MSTKYRVDRVDTLTAPCGMSSIIYLGDSKREATQVLLDAELKRKGVALFEWDNERRNYIAISWRGITTGGK
jgi:metallophosphoesterase superfamily enzyme